MYRLMLALSFLAVTAATGLSQAGSATAGAGTIDPGMTRAQVIEHLGKPATIRNYEGTTYLMYSNNCGKRCGMQDVVILDHDVVVDAMFRSPNRHYTGTSSSPDATKPNSRTQRSQPLAVPGGEPAASTTTLPTLQNTTTTTVVHTSTTTRPADSAKTPTSYPPHDSAKTPTSKPPADSAKSSTSLPPMQSPPARQIEPPLKDPQQGPPAPPNSTAPPTYGTPSTTPRPADSARSSMSHPPVDNSSSSTSHPPKPPQ